jgi:hypothetical protein
VLGTAIPDGDAAIIALVTETVGGEWGEVSEKFPAPKDTNVSGVREQRGVARSALKELVLCLPRIAANV